MKFRKKPIVVDAIRYTGDNLDELRAFVPECHRHNKVNEPLGIITLEGVMTISEGDWVIRGAVGEYYPCKPDAFEASFESLLTWPNLPSTPAEAV